MLTGPERSCPPGVDRIRVAQQLLPAGGTQPPAPHFRLGFRLRAQGEVEAASPALAQGGSVPEQSKRAFQADCARLPVEPFARPNQLPLVRLVMIALRSIGEGSTTPADGHATVGFGRMMFVEPGPYIRNFR